MNWREYDRSMSHFIESTGEAGLRLHIRSRSDDLALPPVLFVHGATYASRLFDIPSPGASWLEAARAAGFAAYAVDIRGYGLSHSVAMENTDAPYARATDAIRDIDDAVNWIRKRHGTSRISVIGGSWGSITTGLYASTIGAKKLRKLILYAPIYAEPNKGWHGLLCNPEVPAEVNPDLGASRLITESDTRARWDSEIPTGADWRNEAVFQALVQSSMADDPQAIRHDPPAFRAPNGTLLDLWSAFNGKPLYDPAAIACPVMLIRGTADPTSTRSDAMTLFDALETAVDRRYVEIANGAHFISAECRAPSVFSAANGFLAEAGI